MLHAESVALASFRREFGVDPQWVVRAPGRVNLIGEHTDYNDGFVLPIAIQHHAAIAMSPRPDAVVDCVAADLGDRRSFAADNPVHTPGVWVEYLTGLAWSLSSASYEIAGWNGSVSSTVPVGSGLSSSAALTVAATQAFSVAAGFEWKAKEMAVVCRQAENGWLGVQSGIMDQYVSAAAKLGSALFIDCRSLETTDVALPAGVAVVVMDTMTRRGLVDSEYNNRRAQCEKAARHLGVDALRDASIEMLDGGRSGLDDETYRRARHIITENARVLDAVASSDAETFGRLMTASHESMRDDFEISTSELDLMVELALESNGCHGARLTGAGFGGAGIALVQDSNVDAFMDSISRRYRQATGIDPNVFVAAPSAGASRQERT